MVTRVSKLPRGITALLETWIYLYSTCRQIYREVNIGQVCYLWWTCFFPQATSGKWRVKECWCRTWPPQKRETRHGIWRETLAGHSERGGREKGELWDKDQQPTRHGQQVTLTQLDRNVRVTGLRRQKTVNVTHCSNTDTFAKHCEGLPLDNSLPISSGKA